MRRLVLLPTLFIGLAGAGPGCAEGDCTTDADCGAGQICRVGLCVRDLRSADTTLPDVPEDVSLDCDPAAAGDLVLNEILADPPAGADVNGDGVPSTSDDEFVEVVNVSAKAVSLANVQIDVNGKQAALGHLCLDPNQARVLYGKDGLPQMTNSGASISLLIDGLTVQNHTYGSEGGGDQSLTLTTQLDPAGGWSKHLDLVGTDYSPGTCANGNDFPDCEGGATVEDDPDGGNSGDVVPACSVTPRAGELLINEVMADPGVVNDANQDGAFDASDDEFVELVNVSADTLLLTGVTVSEGGGKTFTFPAGTCLEPDKAAVVFAKYEGGGDFKGALAFGFGAALSLNNGGDSVFVRDADGELIDDVTYGAEAGDDQSITRAIDMDPGSQLVKHTAAAGAAGATMSPGTCVRGDGFPNCGGGTAEVVEDAPDTSDTADTAGTTDTTSPDDTVNDTEGDEVGPTCGPAAAAGDLVINEVMGHPDGADLNQDGVGDNSDDEFVEIVSTATGAVDLSGVVVCDAADNTFVFGDVCLQPGEAVLVFGGGKPFFSGTVPSGNATPQTGLPRVNNGEELLKLVAAGADLESLDCSALTDAIDSYSHTSAPAGASMVRDPDKTGAFVNHSRATNTSGAASVGLCIDGSAFPGCQ